MTVLNFDIADRKGRWVRSFICQGTVYLTWSGSRWNALISRTKVGGSQQRNNPTYVGSTNDFGSFQAFVDWARSQKGYCSPEYQIDKDIKIRGNKSYSSETCFIVPKCINILVNGRSLGGEYPTGVTWNKRDKCFSAQISKFNKHVHLGNFNSCEEASNCYINARNLYLTEVLNLHCGKLESDCVSAIQENFAYENVL